MEKELGEGEGGAILSIGMMNIQNQTASLSTRSTHRKKQNKTR